MRAGPQNIAKLRAYGMSYRDIAHRYGVTVTTLYRWRKPNKYAEYLRYVRDYKRRQRQEEKVK